MSNEFDRLIRAAFESMIAEVPELGPSPNAVQVGLAREARRHRPSWDRVVAIAAVTLLVIGTIGVLLTRRGGDGVVPVASIPTAGPSTVVPDSSPTTPAAIDVESTPAPTIAGMTTSAPNTAVATTPPSTDGMLPVLPIGTDQLQQMTLQLDDVSVGATVGDDSRCEAPLGTEGVNDGLRAVMEKVESLGGSVDGCFAQFEFSNGEFVHSLVVALPTEQAAIDAASPSLITDLVAYFAIGCCSESSLGTLTPVAGAETDGWEASAPDQSLVLRAWRNASTIGIVAVHLAGTDSSSEADRLAAIQRNRMTSTG